MMEERLPQQRYDPQRRILTRCQADDDGMCEWLTCPQLRDGEPRRTGRHCPWDLPPHASDD
jgi:hypothetical protein